jgi:hypothetical protein
VRRILLVRPAVEAGEKLGFLPGDLAQKIDPYLRPLYDALYEMLGFETVNKLIERHVIEVCPLAYMRGRTLNHAFVILDEAQNTTPEQMKMFLTRIGFGSKAVITGDVTQVDLPRGTQSGLAQVDDIPRRRRGYRLQLVHPARRGAPPAGAAHRRGLRESSRSGKLARRPRGTAPRPHAAVDATGAYQRGLRIERDPAIPGAARSIRRVGARGARCADHADAEICRCASSTSPRCASLNARYRGTSDYATNVLSFSGRIAAGGGSCRCSVTSWSARRW